MSILSRNFVFFRVSVVKMRNPMKKEVIKKQIRFVHTEGFKEKGDTLTLKVNLCSFRRTLCTFVLNLFMLPRQPWSASPKVSSLLPLFLKDHLQKFEVGIQLLPWYLGGKVYSKNTAASAMVCGTE